MKKIILITLFIGIISLPVYFIYSSSYFESNTKQKIEEMKDNIKDISVKDINGNEIALSSYEGKVLLIVNVASFCGYTPQYEGLEEIYQTYKDRGFEILAFPCNQFGQQEPGTNEEIQNFCSSKYNVTFKLFDKIEVNGENRSPLFERLTSSSAIEQGDVKWNFEKFLIAKDGSIVERFRSKVEPTSKKITSAIETELTK
ncbi:MAG TPA: glutathione peroxidase [Ignavibacteriaceae bacterium]|nr:glutathione peroxidase [Ignavibacteriaceae bacterium]